MYDLCKWPRNLLKYVHLVLELFTCVQTDKTISVGARAWYLDTAVDNAHVYWCLPRSGEHLEDRSCGCVQGMVMPWYSCLAVWRSAVRGVGRWLFVLSCLTDNHKDHAHIKQLSYTSYEVCSQYSNFKQMVKTNAQHTGKYKCTVDWLAISQNVL